MNNDLFTKLGDIFRPVKPTELPPFCWGVKDGKISILDNKGNANTPHYLAMMGILSGEDDNQLADGLNASLSITPEQRKTMENIYLNK